MPSVLPHFSRQGFELQRYQRFVQEESQSHTSKLLLQGIRVISWRCCFESKAPKAPHERLAQSPGLDLGNLASRNWGEAPPILGCQGHNSQQVPPRLANVLLLRFLELRCQHLAPSRILRKQVHFAESAMLWFAACLSPSYSTFLLSDDMQCAFFHKNPSTCKPQKNRTCVLAPCCVSETRTGRSWPSSMPGSATALWRINLEFLGGCDSSERIFGL